MNRALPVIIAFALTLGAFGSAFAVNTALRIAVAPDATARQVPATSLAEGEAPIAAKAARRDNARVRSETEYLHDILKRNIFDVEFIKNYKPIQAGNGKDEVVAEARTDLKVKLLGTVVAIPADYSSALIVEDGEDIAVGYGIGDRIGDAEVIGIEQKLVTLKRGDGRVEQLTMDDEQRPPPSRPVAADKGDGGGEGIEQISETKFVVDRELLDKHLQDLEGLSRLGRALLNRGPDGDFDGYRLSAIRRNTVVDQLGIKNGDVIHAVNGQPLNSVQGAMNAYQNMANDRNFSFEVTRRGQKMTLEYEVR